MAPKEENKKKKKETPQTGTLLSTLDKELLKYQINVTVSNCYYWSESTKQLS